MDGVFYSFWFRLVQCFACLLLLLSTLPALSRSSVFEETGIPEGFDDLTSPQVTQVDIYYGGRFLDAIKAEYSSTFLELMDPDKVVSLIPGITNSPLLIDALSGPLDRHDAFICYSGKDCPAYRPEVAGIVFEESQFRVTVYINPDFLAPADLMSDRYLPPSTSDLSFFQGVNLAFAGTKASDSENTETWALSGRSLVSAKEKSIESFWSYDEEQKLGIQSLSLSQDKNGVSYGGGLIQSQSFGLTFTSDQVVFGARIGSSLRTLLDNGITQSSRLEIYRAQRGLVEVFRDGRLLYSELQEAGNQLINTASFPSGAYDITIKIYSDNLLQQEETRFFVKTTYLPPLDEPQYFIEAGRPVFSVAGNVWPSSKDELLIRAGYNWRVSETSALTTAVASTRHERLGELNFLHLGSFYQAAVGGMLADRQRYGLSGFGSFYLKGASINLSYRRLWSDPRLSTPSTQDYLLLGDGFYQASLSLGVPIHKGSLNVHRNYNRTDTSKEQKVIDGISFSQSVGRLGDYDFRVQSNLSKENTQFKIQFGIELKQSSKYWSRRVSYKALYNENHQNDQQHINHDNHYAAHTTWYDKDLFIDKIEADGFAEKQDEQITVGGAIRYTGQYLDSTLGVNHVRPDNGSRVTSYSGLVRANLFTDGGQIIIGANNNSESGLLVKLNGREAGEFDIFINGQKQGYATVGNSTLINLSAFNSYTVSIRSRGDAHFEYDQREYQFTLYPGNVQSYTWQIEKILILIGQLLDSNGDPVPNTHLKGGSETITTDEYGYFQASITTDTRTLTADLPNKEPCLLTVPETLNVRRGVALVGMLTCE